MGVRQVLWACNRRWRLIVLVVAFAMVLGLLTAPSSADVARKEHAKIRYNATHTLEATSKTRQNLPKLILEATTGPVPTAVAKKLGDDPAATIQGRTGTKAGTTNKAANGGPALQGSTQIGTTSVTVEADASSGAIRIKATDELPKRAVRVADGLANELVRHEIEGAATGFNQSYARLNDQINAMQERVDEVNVKIAPLAGLIQVGIPHPAGYDTLDSQRQQLNNQIGDLLTARFNLSVKGPPAPVLKHLAPAVSTRESQSTSLGAPTSRKLRVASFALVGLLVSILLALFLDHNTSAIYGIPSAEAATKLPVISEIPFVKLPRAKRYEVLAHIAPSSRVAESYRALRSSIALIWFANSQQDSDAIDMTAHAPKVVMVVSPGPGEGKSTTTANLAACYAELGDRVIVIDLDSRRQKLHRFLGASQHPHLENIGTINDPRIDLDAVMQDSAIPGVKFISSPASDDRPGEALVATRAAITEARERADVIILDTPPLLLTNSAFDLMDYADAVLLLAKDAHTKRAAAERASQLLRRLDAPVVGLTIVGAVSSRRGYGYGYGYGYGAGYGAEGKTRDLDLTRAESFEKSAHERSGERNTDV